MAKYAQSLRMTLLEDKTLDLDWDLALHLGDPSSVMELVAEQVKPDIILDEKAREIFEWQMEHVREHGFPASPKVLSDEFPEWSEHEPETAIRDLLVRMRERYIRNQGRDRVRHLADLANTDPLSLSKELMLYGRQLADLTAKRGEVYTARDFHRTLDYYYEKGNRGRGPSLGFDELDEHFNGQLGVTFIMAPPKTYKSWYSTKVSLANVLRGLKPYMYALELPAIEQTWRLQCMAANVPYWKYLKNCMSQDDHLRVRTVMETLKELDYWTEKPPVGERSVTRMVEKALNANADCVIIDQLQYVEDDKGRSLGALNNTGDYFDAVNLMRNYSDQIPIFVVHQFNRSVMNTKGLPEMQQGKGSSAIEEVATLALGLWADKDMRSENEVEVGTLCSRNYSYGAWRLGINLSSGCNFELKYRVGDEEDE